jgi:hypothetical protein
MATLYFQKDKIVDVTYDILEPGIAEAKYPAQVSQFATNRFIEIKPDQELPANMHTYRLQDGETSIMINVVYRIGAKLYLATY